MSRNSLKTKPAKGTVISSIWKYVVVVVSQDHYAIKPTGNYDVFEMSKHKTLAQAQAVCKDGNDNELQYALERGRKPPTCDKFHIAVWKQQDDGEIVLVLT